MNLPDYFLADLPAEAELTATLITEACQTLKRNREQYLANRSTESIIRFLDRLAQDWLSADYHFRRLALQLGPAATGFSEPVLAAGLDQFFNQLTAENMEALLRQELGHPRRLDDFHPDEHQVSAKRTALACGPALLAHIVPGNIPNPVLTGIVLGLLTRSAQFVKCASGSALLPRLFAHSIYEADRKLGSCLELAEWKGGNHTLENALFAEADCVAATGSDEMLEAIARKIPRKTRFLSYGTRVSFGYVTKDALGRNAETIAQNAAADVAAWNQRGCLSPHVIYVEESGAITPESFAARLADQLEALEKTFPRGPLPVREAAAVAIRRSFYEVRAAHMPETKMWASVNSTAWTVVLETDPCFQLSCLNRFIYIKAVPGLNQALQGAEPVREQLSTVGLASAPDQARDYSQRLARWGARRVCPMGRMQNPPLGWRHDGYPPLAGLVTWIDWEKP
jgi:hypothetical protein